MPAKGPAPPPWRRKRSILPLPAAQCASVYFDGSFPSSCRLCSPKKRGHPECMTLNGTCSAPGHGWSVHDAAPRFIRRKKRAGKAPTNKGIRFFEPGFGSQDRIPCAILWTWWTLWTKWTRKSISLRVKPTGSTTSISSMVWSKEPRSTADFKFTLDSAVKIGFYVLSSGCRGPCGRNGQENQSPCG